jgi:hypothetical protein
MFMRVGFFALQLLLLNVTALAFADQFRDNLTAAFESFHSELDLDPEENKLLNAWELLRQYVENRPENEVWTYFVPPTGTANKKTSQLIFPPPSMQNNFWSALLAVAVAQNVGNNWPPPKNCALSSDWTTCCGAAPDLQCVKRYPSQPDSFGIPLSKLNFFGAAVNLLANEIAKNSFLVSIQTLREAKLPGNQIFYAWRYRHEGRYMLTRIDSGLVERISTLLHHLRPRIIKETRQEEASSDSYVCHDKVLLPEPWPTGTSGSSLLVSPSQPSTVRSLTGPLPSTVEITPMTQSFGLRFVERTAPPIGGENNAWLNFFEIAKGKKSFFCLLGNTAETLGRAKRWLNNPEASVTFFYSLYLMAVWEELHDARY